MITFLCGLAGLYLLSARPRDDLSRSGIAALWSAQEIRPSAWSAFRASAETQLTHSDHIPVYAVPAFRSWSGGHKIDKLFDAHLLTL